MIIEKGTTIICDRAFEGCTSLESIDIPDSVTKIDAGAFSGCTSLKSIDIPNSVTEIGGYAFSGCTSLKSIDIPNSVMIIGDSAFKDCTSLKSIDIPNSVTKIDGYAFSCCTSLESINIPNSVTIIGGSAFEHSGLQSLRIPFSIREIGERAIYNCPIISITVDEKNQVFFSKDDVLYKKLEGGKNVLVKYAPKKMGKSFHVDEKTIMLDSFAFEGAEELEEIILHDNILSLGNERTFERCISLKEIRIPSGIVKIPKVAFSFCTSMKEVVLPDSDHYSIKESVFSNCTSLKSIHSVAKNIDDIVIDEEAFDEFDIDQCTLYVPSGTRWAYRHHRGFGKFKNIEIEKKD